MWVSAPCILIQVAAVCLKSVEPEVFDAGLVAEPCERHADLLRCEPQENRPDGIAVRERSQHRSGKLVQVHDSAVSVLGLGKQQAPAVKVHVEPAEPQDLTPPHPCC
jgi:hypothetical protein